MRSAIFDDGNPLNRTPRSMGWLGHGPLPPVSLTPDKRNWQNVYYSLRTGGVNPASVDQVIKDREAAAAKAAGTAGLGDDSRGRQQLKTALAVIRRLRAENTTLKKRLNPQQR